MRPRLDCDRSATGSSPRRRFSGHRPLGWASCPATTTTCASPTCSRIAVERVTVARFRAEDLRVDTKPDLTLVSDADRDAEELIRSQLKRTRPRDAVIGEEFAPTGSSPRQWVVDPIDGTHNFVRGVPVLGDPHRAGRRRHPGHRPGRGAGPGPALVGGARLGCLGRAQPDLGQADARVAGVAARGRLDLLLELDVVGCRRPPGRGARPGPGLLARARLRRLLVLHAARRGGGRHRGRARARVCTTWRPWCRSSPRPGAGSPRWPGVDGPFGGNAVATNGILHDEVLSRIGVP